MGALIYQWIDLIWLPIGWFAVDKKYRLKTLSFIITCILVLRTQVELIDSTGYDSGFLPFLQAPALTRGYIVYGITITVFLILAHYSKTTPAVVFLAAMLSLFFFAFCTSFIVMVL